MQNMTAAIDHLKNHQTYPATDKDLKATCNSLSDFTKEDKGWFEKNLPEGEYNSATEVIQALGWKEEQSGQAGHTASMA